MTLIVARIYKENIYIESDSKITDERLVRSDPLCGILKTLILHPFVSVSFAGNVNYAELAIKNFFKYAIDDVNVLLQMLLNINIESCNATDFIVATITDRTPRLFKISDGQVIDGAESAWIGDIKGFEIYQREFHSQKNTVSLKEKIRT